MSRWRTPSSGLLPHGWAFGSSLFDDAPFAPAGTVATVARVIRGSGAQPLSILVMSRSPRGLGLRSPIGLHIGSTYRLQIGTAADDSVFIRITSSRLRHGNGYDIGAVELEAAGVSRSVAA